MYERNIHRETQTHRNIHTDTQTHGNTHTQIDTTHTYTHTDTHTCTHTNTCYSQADTISVITACAVNSTEHLLPDSARQLTLAGHHLNASSHAAPLHPLSL